VAFHGKADTTVPYSGGDGDIGYRRGYMSAPSSVDTFAKRDGCDSSSESVRANGNVVEKDYSGCDGGSAVVFVTIGDLTHKWPGDRHGFGLLTDRSDVRATDKMWEIFKTHPKL
jgi:Poly(3-hydroxybutyrate) depolymerase